MRLLIRIPCPWFLRRHAWRLELDQWSIWLECPQCGAKTPGWDLRLPKIRIPIAWWTKPTRSAARRSAHAN